MYSRFPVGPELDVLEKAFMEALQDFQRFEIEQKGDLEKSEEKSVGPTKRTQKELEVALKKLEAHSKGTSI